MDENKGPHLNRKNRVRLLDSRKNFRCSKRQERALFFQKSEKRHWGEQGHDLALQLLVRNSTRSVCLCIPNFDFRLLFMIKKDSKAVFSLMHVCSDLEPFVLSLRKNCITLLPYRRNFIPDIERTIWLTGFKRMRTHSLGRRSTAGRRCRSSGSPSTLSRAGHGKQTSNPSFVDHEIISKFIQIPKSDTLSAL